MVLCRRALLTAAVAVLWLAAPPLASAADVSARAYLDSNRASVGEVVTLTVEITGAQNVAAPGIPDIDGLTIRYVGPSTQVSIVNGSMSATVQHRYSVVATKEGSFVIGPLHVQYDGRDYDAGSVRLQVAPAAQAGSQANGPRGRQSAGGLSLELQVAKNDVYLQQRVPVTVTLVVGQTRIDDVQYPKVDGDGFALDPFGQPTQSDEVRDGRRVHVVRFHTMAVPLRSGALTLGPAHMSMSVLVNRRRGAGDAFFDRFFSMDPFAQHRPIELRADGVAMQVQPLPEAGRPADFTGAVGQFDLEVSAKPTELHAGDPVTVHMRVSGEGNFATVDAPHIDAGSDFKAYPTQTSPKPGDGEKVFEQVLIPLHAGAQRIPAVRFSFFDPEAGTYRTLARGPFPLTVQAPTEEHGTKVVEAPQAQAAKPAPEKLGRDIVYIKDSPGTLLRRGHRFYDTWWFLLLQPVPLLAFAGAWTMVRRRERLHSDPRYARYLRAGREARKALGEIEQVLRRGEHEHFDDTVGRAMRDYLSAKLDLPPGGVDAERAAERLSRNGTGPEITAQIHEFFGVLERIRYTPGAAAEGDRQQAIHLARAIVDKLERRGPHLERLVAAAAILLLAAPLIAAVTASPTAAFYGANTAYGDGQWQKAIDGYQSVLAAGLESAAVYYNLGNAYEKSGHPGLAILNYERARRLAPADADIRANLQFAREEGDIEPETALWERLAFPLGERLSTAALVLLTSGLYTLAMLLLIARLLWPRASSPAGRGAVAVAVLLLVCSSSLGYRVWRYHVNTSAVVTQPGNAAVRFEPSEDGTTYFKAPEGSVLRVVERRAGWVQVARPDGRRGWIAGKAITDI